MIRARNGRVKLCGDDMDYIVFGYGERPLIMLPGIGDGLKTVRGMAVPFAMMYRKYARTFRVYVFSRRNHLPEGYGTEEMADDLAAAMDQLGIPRADVIGVSMGGMIAQHMALKYPERIGKLILAVTSSRPNRILADSISAWKRLAEKGDYRALMTDSAKRMYSERYLKKNGWLLALTAGIGKPKTFDRFLIMADACMEHHTYERLGHIGAETLVIGGKTDKALGADASKEMAENIPNCRLKLYEEYGHAVYEEARDFDDAVLTFLD